ncbi:50S ribosomal protein L34 [Candidatus Woesebacteria bacterium RIFOXYC1_FULL_31_51]|nr:MAG: 50S ribosomal protein L34 [Candidatus Woesebacteria bacterium GW2011_GWF1_31_35]OGM72948.1 MAG: 50S ribosomal protein L34 [Candidatus Woesebacteria bacterium RIFOXYA1_FULL_31_71]OGM77928.1 MAG: 50S ribosomal protein L34 [Candidatus Woesebacteria bacterium RIFOXYB1_FULL_31_120]OGM82158.1 MAG: 50S ribosomal protein L34 [Candidatus Woesebacteria bacterium RIFOXYC1_FULL_31_51]OGM86198.1 MAG: 50S ribosomal protein L34 [Candidatus Woesebacteria bacterium RIFOXYD1_FULL_31_53]HBP39935.1 50S ri
MSTKRTYQPHKLKRIKKFGFMSRNSSINGRKVLKRRILKGRKKIVNA